MKIRKLTAVLLALCLMLSAALPTAMADEGENTIASAEEFAAFSKNCSLDVWSQGKTFRLTADIDLSGSDFAPIPTFGGTFYGDGHTISGLRITSGGSQLGLFRHIQAGAVVQDLLVSGIVTPEGSRSAVGGIAGQNAGAIRNCTFRGTVKGENAVGGIAGRNDSTGEVAGCSAGGVVQGMDCTGGIVGRNEGLLLQCTNAAGVNTVQQDTPPDLEALASGALVQNTASADGSDTLLRSHTDTGGVAGYSSGAIQSCVNNGAVGYPHVGYNVGGIAGRQTGYLAGCVNHGAILGRKDVGGIAGQAEPYLTLGADSDTLERLRKELNALDELVQTAIDHTQQSGSDLSARMERIRLSTDAAKDSSKRLLDHTADFVDGNVAALNSFSASVTAALDAIDPALEELADAAEDLTLLADKLETALDTLSDTAALGQSALKDARAAAEELRQASKALHDALTVWKSAADRLRTAAVSRDEAAARTALSALSGAAADIGSGLERSAAAQSALHDALGGLLPESKTGDALQEMAASLRTTAGVLKDMAAAPSLEWPNVETLLGKLRTALRSLKDAAGHLKTAAADFQKAVIELEKSAGALSKAFSQLADAADVAGSVSQEVESALDAVRDAVETLTEDGPLELVSLGQETRDAGDALYASLSDLSEGMESLQATAGSAGDTLAADLRAVGKQMNRVMNLVLDALTDMQSTSQRELIEDTSDENIAATRQGKIADCRNTGTVEGDRNVGGGVGSMSIEYDLDPEDDTERFSLGSTYETKAVLEGCVNHGSVTAKKDCAGGLAGRMDLGTALRCESYGSVASTGGDYVGGIVGYGDGTVRDSYAKCVLSGSSYVGGIAGWASRLQNCAAIATIAEAEESIGAIAGDGAMEDGGLIGNRFVDTGVAGIDGVSYAGVAEPVAFETLRAMEGVPTEFLSFTLTLKAADRTVAAIPFRYGEDLGSIQLPQVPPQEGFYGTWPDFDTSGLSSDITLEAVYTPWITLIASDAADGVLALALAEGRFTEEAALQVSTSDHTPPAAVAEGRTADVWTLTLTGTDTGEADVPIRLLNRTGGKAEVWQLTGSGWKAVDAAASGHYLLLTMAGTTGTFCVCAARSSTLVILLALIAALAVLLLGAALVIRRGKRKKAVKAAAAK